MTEIKIHYQDVMDAARAVIASSASGREGMWTSWELPGITARALGVQDYRNQASTAIERSAAERFDRQVSRAFSQLADGGTLRKVGQGKRGPDGKLSHTVQFYTPGAWEAAEQRAARQQAEDEAATVRWIGVFTRLADRGLHPVTLGGVQPNRATGKPVTLTLDEWETLLGDGSDG